MDRDEIDTEQDRPRWFIDLDWYQQNNRSFSTLAQRYLCLKCQKRLKKEKNKLSAVDLLSNIRDCCSNNKDYITSTLPVLESVFRLFLSNGNEPLGLEELTQQLCEWHGKDVSRNYSSMLPRLVNSDRFYGLREVGELS